MKGKVCIFSAIIFLQLLALYCVAQNNNIQFNLIKGPGGKPLGKITDITQDPHGYIWFCGDGIYRYDGIRLINMIHDSLNANSLGMINCERIYADDSGMIWVGGNGLDKYNPSTGIFKHYGHDPKDTTSLIDDNVNAILKDRKGRLWVGTRKGLDRLDEKTGKFIHYQNEPGNPRSLSNDVVNIIYEDHGGAIWIGTGWRWFNMKTELGGLNRLDADGGFTRYLHDPKDEHSLINNKVIAIFEDSRGGFWIGTAGGDGLHKMDRKTGRFQRYLYDPAKPDELCGPHFMPGTVNEGITFIQEDGAGAIWIATREHGVNRYDTGSKKVTHYLSSNGFTDKGGWQAFTSKDGVLWFSTEQSNLFRVDPFLKTINNITIGTHASSFLNDKYGSVLFSAYGRGIREYDQKNNLYLVPNKDSSDPSGLVNVGISAVFQSLNDTIWVGSEKGIGTFNATKKQLSRTELKGAINDSTRVNAIVQDKEGYMWFGTWDGLVRYNSKDGSVKVYHSDSSDSGAISTDRINHAMVDSKDDIWAGGFSSDQVNRGGLNRFNKKSGHFKHYLEDSYINFVYEDSDGSIWSGSEKGIYRLKKGEESFVPFVDSQSTFKDISIKGMIEDDFKNLWFYSPSSIIKLNPERNRTYTYDNKFGITPNTLNSGIFKTANGRILVGNSEGFYSFFPGELDLKATTFAINITDFFVNNLPWIPGNNSPIKKSIEEYNEMALKYDQDNFSFNFAGVDYRSPEDNKYFVKLENYDKNWRDASAEKSASYFYVRPGDYTFRIKGISSDGTIGEKAISIHISPPWWQTWWAYTIYSLITVVAILSIYRMQKQRIIRRERQKAQQIELAQAKEIEKAYHELRATQAQLIQSEKMASLGELTAGIAHEIQNPLNFVNNFSEVNKELLEELHEVRKSDPHDLQNENELLRDIEQNLEKVIHHGKRADAIVKGMLQHSRTSTGEKELTDINALADEYLRMSYHGMRGKDKHFNATMKTDFDPAIGKINIIPQDIGRVLLNMYNNAFYTVNEKKKHKGDGYEPAISISTKKVNDKIEITVKDNGNGIPEKIKEKIFQPFFTTKPTGQGTGLGLSLSYDIIKVHGGELKVETKEGEGSEFIVKLPLV